MGQSRGSSQAGAESVRSRADPKGSSRKEGEAEERSRSQGSGTTPRRTDGPRKADTEGPRPEPSRKAERRSKAGGGSPTEPTKPRHCRGTVASSSEKEPVTRQGWNPNGWIARADEAAPERDGLSSVPGRSLGARTLARFGSPSPARVEAEGGKPRRLGQRGDRRLGCPLNGRLLFGTSGQEGGRRVAGAPEAHPVRQVTVGAGRFYGPSPVIGSANRAVRT